MDENVDVTEHRKVLEQRPAPDWPTLTHHTHWGPLASLLALAAHLEHAPEPGQGLDRAEMEAGLALGRAAEEALSRAAYIVGAHARACGWTWPEIARAQGLDNHKGVMKRHGRLAERHADYRPPLAHTLEAHRVRAWELLLATGRELSPNARRTAADRLGAALLAATLTRAPSALVTAWLDQEGHTLHGALAALGPLPGAEAGHARRVLRDHAMDGPGTRADLLTYMREALRMSPWALASAPAPAVALEAAEPGAAAGANTPPALGSRVLTQALRELREVIADLDPTGTTPVGSVLVDLSNAILAEDAAQLNAAIQAAKEQQADALSSALGPAGSAAWDQVHQAWKANGPQGLERPLLGAGEVTQPESGLAELYTLKSLIPERLDAEDTGPPARALRALAQRIGSHAGRAEFYTALHQVADLGADVRRGILGLAGEEVWQRVYPLCLAQDVTAPAVDPMLPPEPSPSAETGLDVGALVAIDGGVGVLNVAVDHDGGRVQPGRAAPETLRRLRGAGLVDDGGQVTDRGRAALPLATDRVAGRNRGAASGYAPVLVRAGLAPAAAAALTAPLAAFVAAVELIKDQQVDGELRGVLHALAPVLHGADPARVRFLLGTLPHLNLVGLEEWAVLALAVAEHAPHLDERTNTAALVEGAGLPSGAARPLAELVDAARLPALASYAPGAPASTAADDLAAVIVAVDTANASDLPALLDQLVQAERLDLDADQPHRLTSAWEDLVHALTDGEPADAG